MHVEHFIIAGVETAFVRCVHGDVRLVDGPNVREGRVEVCVNNAWGTVCSVGFGREDAAVVCSSMEFEKEGITFQQQPSMLLHTLCIGAVYQGTLPTAPHADIPIFLSGLHCTENNYDILQCDSDPLGLPHSECLHENDVRVHCEGMCIVINSCCIIQTSYSLVHCPHDRNMSNYGSYTWLRSSPETTVCLECEFGDGLVSRRCNERGRWDDMNTTLCWTASQNILNSTKNIVRSSNYLYGD